MIRGRTPAPNGDNVHAFDYPAGRHTIKVRGTGACVVLGIVQPPAR